MSRTPNIKRKRKVDNFTRISNDVFEAGVLSFQAMGMLSFLLSKPDDWKISVAHLQKVTTGTAKKTGRDGVYKILSELIDRGFCERIKFSDGETEYVVQDFPITQNTEKEEPDPSKPDTEKPDTPKPTLLTTDLKTTTELIVKEKNTKKDKLDFTPLGLTDEQIIEWKDLRKSAKAPVNQRVINSIAKEFDKSRQAGFTNDQILDLLSEKGWKGYKHEWMLNSNQTMGAQVHGQQQTTKEHNGIGYGEFADQSIFPEHLQIAHNDSPALKGSKTAMQLTRIRKRSGDVLGEDDRDIRGFVEDKTGPRT